MTSDKNFLYHLIISQLYHDGFGPHASLLEQAALSTNRAIAPSDRLKQMLAVCAHTVREVDDYFTPNSADSEKTSSFSPVERRSCTPSPYHTLARRRITAAKRHSLMSLNRGKHMRSSPKTLYTNTIPKTSNIPIVTPTSSETASLTTDSSELMQTFFAAPESGIFSNSVERANSAETVRVLQNIFQKRDVLPSVPPVGEMESEISKDLTSLIQATPSSAEDTPANAEPSNSSTTPLLEVDERPVMMASSAFSPISKSPKKSPITQENMVVEADGMTASAVEIENEQMKAASIVSLQSSPLKPTSPHISQPGPTKDASLMIDGKSKRDEIETKEEQDNEMICQVKEEVDVIEKDEPVGGSPPVCYTPVSQDIINQLNSLSASGIASGIGNIQSLANSLTSSLCDPTSLQDPQQLSNLSGLSLNLPESLASSLNLSVSSVTGGCDQLSPSGTSNSQLNQTYGGMNSNKFDILNRLEGTDSPSMLSMVNTQSRSSGGILPSSQDWNSSATTNPPLSSSDEKFYQCPYCPKVYTTTQSLHRHKHSHTGTNMKACPLCGKTSYRVDNLKSHIRNCYKKRLRLESIPGNVEGCTLSEST